MNRSYNHIKNFADNNDVLISNIQWLGWRKLTWQHHPKHQANQLDDKQRHTGFDYYEYDMP